MNITMYTTSTCGFCKVQAAWMEKLGVKFELKDVGKDKEAAEELKEKANGHMSVPVTDIDGTIIRGFDRKKLQEALNV